MDSWYSGICFYQKSSFVEDQGDDGWRLVTTRHRRRKSGEADSILITSKEGERGAATTVFVLNLKLDYSSILKKKS